MSESSIDHLAYLLGNYALRLTIKGREVLRSMPEDTVLTPLLVEQGYYNGWWVD